MISVDNLCLTQGSFSLEAIHFDIPVNTYAVLMGGSGSGKTTIMETICGLRKISSGTIKVGGNDVSDLRPAERRIAYVPQDGALFPTLNVGEQIAFSLNVQKRPTEEVNKIVLELAEKLEIIPLLQRMPQLLSGGEIQRVALARALAMEPAALCLDEPLSALDEDLHDEICELLRTVVKERCLSVLHITHSKREAKTVADLLLRIEKGQIHTEVLN